MAFFSTSTIVPAFLSKLGAGNTLIGLLPALITIGYNGPGIFVAARTARLPRARAWLFPVAIMERVPLLLMGICAYFISGHSALLLTFLILFGIHAFTLGLNQPAYSLVISKSIPELWRGRLYGFAGLAGGICGFAVLPITGYLLRGAGLKLQHGFAWCFIIGALIEFASVIPLGFVREPRSEPPELGTEGEDETIGLRSIWLDNPGFRRFIWAQGLFSVWMIALPFYLMDGIRRLHISGPEIGIYAATGVIVAAFGGPLCGLLSDRHGNRLVLLVTVAAGALASLYAMAAPGPALLNVVFGLSSFAVAGAGLASFNITMEFAPTDKHVPHFNAFYNLAMAPVRSLSLVAGGLISQNFNYEPVFMISAGAAVLSVVLTWQILEPRHESNARPLQETQI
jgi:MFS family permease